MNTNNLAKCYDRLTARERLPLILAAAARKDEVEQKRLLESAPRIGFQAPHHYVLAEAVTEAARFHMITLLDLATKYWQWWGLWGWHCVLRQPTKVQRRVRGKRGAAPDPEEVRLCGVTRYHAFLFITYVDGWKQFCADLSMDADMLLNCCPGWEMLTRTEQKARKDAYSIEDARMFLLCDASVARGAEAEDRGIPSIPPVPTVAGLAKEWHGVVDRQTEALCGSR